MSFLQSKIAGVCLVIFFCLLTFIYGVKASYSPDFNKLKETPSLPQSNFSPSNARTADGNLIPSEQFISATRCANCHQDTHVDWSESLHRNAAREPFYKESVDILQRQRGIEFTRHCESCHAPIALLSGALTTGSQESRHMDDEGVTCTVCHSITEARLDGTGSYTIRRPVLLEKADGTLIYGQVTDDDIKANISDHKRAMMRPLLKSAEFCATCHKASAPPTLNNYKFTRGFNAYDEWQTSGASTQSLTPFYRKDKQVDCRGCHMPDVEVSNDMAAKNGLVASHRFLGANTAVPLFYSFKNQLEQTKKFLESSVVSLDIFAVKNEATGSIVMPLEKGNSEGIVIAAGNSLTVELVVFNRRAAHSFPPELRDMYEPWVEFEVINDSGQTIFHSGFVKPDQTLDEKAHVYKAILLDSSSKVITRHQVWVSAIKAYDNFIPQGRGDLVRFNFTLPSNNGSNSATLTLRARLNYRRFIQEYTDYVLQRNNATHLEMPIVKMAETVLVIGAQKGKSAKQTSDKESSPPGQRAQRWNDYAIALMGQAQYEKAAEAFKQAHQLDSQDADYLTSAAVAEMSTERFGPELFQLKKARVLIEAALRITPQLPRAKFYQAMIWRGEGRISEAAAEFQSLARDYPKDRELLRQLGLSLYALGRIAEATQTFESILRIDPTDANAYQVLSSLYATSGQNKDAQEFQALYLLWRDDPLAEVVATRFFNSNPNWAEARVPYRVYSAHTPFRPIARGEHAASDK